MKTEDKKRFRICLKNKVNLSGYEEEKKKRIQDDVLAWVPWETELEASAYPLWGAGSQGRKSEG